MGVPIKTEIREVIGDHGWYYVRLKINNMYFDSPTMNLRFAERTIEEIWKVELNEANNTTGTRHGITA